jgi:hypothetical protein
VRRGGAELGRGEIRVAQIIAVVIDDARSLSDTAAILGLLRVDISSPQQASGFPSQSPIDAARPSGRQVPDAM